MQAEKTGKKPLMTTFSVYNLDYSKAREELGYTTRSYQETIRDEVLIESGVVGAFEKMEDHFVDKFFRKPGETVEQAKERLGKK